jgi:hypothetical protein
VLEVQVELQEKVVKKKGRGPSRVEDEDDGE